MKYFQLHYEQFFISNENNILSHNFKTLILYWEDKEVSKNQPMNKNNNPNLNFTLSFLKIDFASKKLKLNVYTI
jgi:hypothetical protein